ncbi:WAT1-related protein At5g40240 [Morus notabilis]|nr:WAT1-related protein At5g40240 [Morus notabilis]
MEDMNLRGSITRIKIIGAMLSVSGPLIAVLYKGLTIPSSASSSPSPTSFPFNSVSAGKIANKLDHRRPFTSLPNHSRRNLTKVIKMYPDEQTVTLVYFICKTIIAVPICFMAETKLSAWRLKPEMWITVITSGFFGPSFTTLLCTWGRHLKGPLYTSIFKPFFIAIAAVFGVIFLGDALCLASVVGATIIVVGIYSVIWGKAQDGPDNLGDSPARKTPLLQSYIVEETSTSR